MRSLFRVPLYFLITVVVLSGWEQTVDAAGIEAVPGKKYTLTKRHGPCMIMVASLKTREEVKNGPTAEEAADALVLELRQLGIPAYAFATEKQFAQVKTFDRRTGRVRNRAHVASDGRVVVLAGNYPSIDDEVAAKTLKYIKNMTPKSFGENGRYVKTPGRSGPLSGAFLSFNPLLSPEEIKHKSIKSDPLIKKMNTQGGDVAIVNNRGRYTVVVASFFGKTSSTTQTTSLEELKSTFEIFNRKGESELQKAFYDSWYLANLLRGDQFQQKLVKYMGESFPAFVYHDHYKSVVTLGEFQRPDDPRIAKLQRLFGAKVKPDPSTGQNVLVAEAVKVPGGKTTKTDRGSFLFDPQPRLFEVPIIR